MNLYNLIFQMVIPFLTQPPPRMHPNWSGQPGVPYLKVGAAGCTLTVGAAYKLYTLIPFLTQPPHERTLTSRGSQVYPKGRGSRVRPGQGRRCARAPPLGSGSALKARCMNSYYNSYTKCMNWYKNHTVYEFILHNLYNNCLNSFV
jgi:hypothetical protein